MPSRGKKLTLLFATLAFVVLGVAGWIGWPWIQFWWRFESIGVNDQGYPEFKHRQTGIVMVRLPGGTFWMGAKTGSVARGNYDPGPCEHAVRLHETTLSPFFMAKCEVTQDQWCSVMGNSPSYFDGSRNGDGNRVDPPVKRDRLPVEQVSWNDIQEFEEATGLTLPTDAQWEYACRGGSTSVYGFGGDPGRLGEYCWYLNNSGNSTHPVGQKRPNDFGLFDMHGNVWEWCEDVRSEWFYSTPEAAGPDPLCTSGSKWHVARGGSYAATAETCCSVSLGGGQLTSRIRRLGFRVAAPCP